MAIEKRAFQCLGHPNDGPVQSRWKQGKLSGAVQVTGYVDPLLKLQGKELTVGLVVKP